jgi:GNAT superfamily N-acetyltransferase
MGEVTVRYFLDSDQPKVAALYKSGENSYIGIPVVGECYRWFVNNKVGDGGDVADIRKYFMSDPGKTCFWVAELDSEIVGFVGAIRSTRFGDDHVELLRMFVSPDVRKKAIGVKLVRTVEEWARDAGYKHVYLSTLAGFPGANVLYRKCGYDLAEAVDIDVTKELEALMPTTVCVNHYVKSLY